MRLLAISGSLQSRSSNAALLEVARAIAPADVEIVIYDGLAGIPPFNPDTDPSPVPIESLRALVQASDGLLFATPEYAHGVPGSLKNLLDWLVGTGEIYGKPVVVLSAAPAAERGALARADLERTLRAQGASVLESTTIAVPSGVRGRESDDPEIRASVERALAAFYAPATPRSTFTTLRPITPRS